MNHKQFVGYLLLGVGVGFPIIEFLMKPPWKGYELIIGRALLYLFMIVLGLVLIFWKKEEE